MPNLSAGVNGKITAGGKPGAQAQVATPPVSFFSIMDS